MAQLVSMKRDDGPVEYKPTPVDAYPYGLRLYLCHEDLEKLGIAELPAPGKTVDLAGKGVVVSITDSVEGRRSLDIQITDLSVKVRATDAAGMLYDKD